MAKELALPDTLNTEIAKQARQIAVEDADDLAVLQFLAQSAATAQLVKLRKLEESKVPIGVKPLKRTVTDTTTKLVLYPPWISFALLNDGTGGLTAWVNSEEEPLVEGMIAGGETYKCDMEYPVIHTIYLKSESGVSNAVRIYGKEGRPV